MTPTAEQQAIIDTALSGDECLLINALAGAAKTTTLELLCNAMPRQPTLSLAFNKRIADEMAKRLPGHVMAATLNSIGHRAWSATCGRRLIVNKDKTYDFLKAYLSELPRRQRQEAMDLFPETLAAIRRAKIEGYIPSSLGKAGLIEADAFFAGLDEAVDESIVNGVLCASIQAAFQGTIDFDDQIYMSTLFGGAFPKFPVVMVDEAQDLSGINHAMLERLASGSRLIAVGDPNQSIYAFRGAVTSSMARLRETFSMREMTLSISFRCPKAVVRRAHSRVPHMQWPDWAIEGLVETKELFHPEEIPDGAAIICRNNAPLFTLALRLIRNNRGVRVVGTDLGPGLVRAMKRLGDDSLSRAGLIEAINSWEYNMISKGKNPENVHEKAEVLRVFAKFGNTLGESCVYAKNLFEETGTINLLSGHKAKGLEWDTVYHLDPWRIPSKYAKTPEALEQEANVDYVITTRAKKELYLVNLEGFQGAIQ